MPIHLFRLRNGLRFVFLLLSFLSAVPIHAQNRNPFGKTPDEFSASLVSYMLSDPNLGKEEKEQISGYLPQYLSLYAGMGDPVRESVAEVARLTYKNRLKAYPSLFRFLQLQALIDNTCPDREAEWIGSCVSLLKKGKFRLFESLVSRTSELLQERQLYKSNAACWKVSSLEGFRYTGTPEPAFSFSGVNLSCSAYGDSTFVYSTSVVYYPLQDRLEGFGGKVYWNRVGLSSDSCWAELESYKVNLRQARMESEKAVLHNLYLFPYPIEGAFADRLTASNRAAITNYPSFKSFASGISIRDYIWNVDVMGPFVQQGRRTRLGTEERPAFLQIRRNDTLLARVQASHLVMDNGQIDIAEGRMVIYMESDSMYNSAVSVRLDPVQRVLHVGEARGYGFSVPFVDTYHQLRMDFESMRWHIDRGEIEIGLLDIPGRVGVAEFKSLALYSREELGELMLGQENNPLYLLASFSKRRRSVEYSLEELASYINMSQVQTLSMLRTPIAFGYVNYDPAAKTVRLLPQLFHNLDVTAGKADFDELEFVTSENGILKAVLRFDSLDIRMSGVSYVLLSNKQNVYAVPSDSVVHIFKNRDFHFNGLLHAGMFNFTVRGARFYYDDFKVKLADIQELGLEVRREEDGELKKRPIETIIRSLTGTLYIDEPGNKGGRKDFPQYPIFESTQPAYAYFDSPEIRKGVYTADSFYFKVDPFRMEKLNTLEVDSVKFAGTLVSAGIFPDIKEELVVRPDYSLGFVTRSPEEGWPCYFGRSVYKGSLNLDKKGLYGEGVFAYLSSEAYSSRMFFEPSQMLMRADRFLMRDSSIAGVSYPQISACDVDGRFMKSPALFELSSVKDSLLHVYAENWTLSGKYSFSPDLSVAQGIFSKSGEAALSADRFRVSSRSFRSDSADFRLLSSLDPGLLYSGPYRTEIDLDSRTGSFSVLSQNAPVIFGHNRYEGRNSAMQWDMERKKVRMEHRTLTDPVRLAALDTMDRSGLFKAQMPGERFSSTRRAQAGLNFHAMSSEFDYGDTTLLFSGVKRVLVADAMFVPDKEQLEIGKDGLVAPFQRASLYFGDLRRLHAFHDVKGNILSADQYKVSGIFDYKAPGLESQPIFFAGIRPVGRNTEIGTREYSSQATARIVADSGFLRLNEGFEFIGKITVSADQTYPFFSGSARMVYSCDFALADDLSSVPENQPYPDYRQEQDYDDFEYSSEETSSEEEYSEDNAENSETGFEEDEGVENEDGPTVDRRTSDNLRRGRKKDDDDELVPDTEAAGLHKGNPFLLDGIQFQSSINSDSVLIPVHARTRSTVGRILGCGFYTPSRNREPKFLFLRQKISTDQVNLAAEGFLNFSAREKSYRVFDSLGREALQVRLGTCFAQATGEADLGMNTYELGIDLFGNMTMDSRNRTIAAQGLFRFDFYLQSEVAKDIAALLNANTQLEGAQIARRPLLSEYLRRNLPKRSVERIQDEINLTGVIQRIPEELRQALVFSDLRLEWDPERKAYLSSGTAELLSVAGTPVNKRMKACVSLRKTRKGDVVDIYLEAASYSWIYFSYTNHYMQIISSDDAFNEKVTQLKSKARKKSRYEFYLSTLSKRNIFVRAFEELEETDQY